MSPYKSYYKNGMWHLQNQDTGKSINVPSASNREEAEQVGKNREMFKHIRAHNRKGTRGVRGYTRR